MHRLNRALSAVVAAVLVATACPAFAHAEDKAAALDLFNAARKDMDAKNYVEACRKLEVAHKYDPSLDGVVLNLASCYQHQGKWATAWGYYRDSLVRAQKAGREDRAEVAKKGIAETEPNISRITIQAATPVQGLEVRRDARVVDAGELGIAVPVDPGEHTITASAPGYAAWTTKITIASTAESRTIEVPALAAAPTATTADLGGAPRSNTAAYVALGSGVLLLGAGVGAHFVASSAYDDYKANCATQLTPTCDDPGGRSKVQSWQAISFVAGGVGLAAAGIGLVLLVTNKRESTPAPAPAPVARITAAPTVGSTGAGLAISGAF